MDCKIHGNSLKTTKPAQGYRLVDKSSGATLKYGETTRGYARYTKKYLSSNNARMEFMASGTKAEMHQWQHQKILEHFEKYLVKPILNKSFW